MYIKEHILS